MADGEEGRGQRDRLTPLTAPPPHPAGQGPVHPPTADGPAPPPYPSPPAPDPEGPHRVPHRHREGRAPPVRNRARPRRRPGRRPPAHLAQGLPVRLYRPLLHPVPGLRALPAPLHGVRLPLPGRAPDERRDGVAGHRQLHGAVHRRVLLDLAAQHVHDRRAVHGPAARDGTRPRPPAQLQAARPDLHPDGDPAPVRDLGGGGHARLRAALRPRLRADQLCDRAGRLRPGGLADRHGRLADRGVVDRDLAVDRLQRTDLPGGHAVDPARAVRGGGDGRGVALAAVHPRDAARPAPHDRLHRHHLHDRRDPALRRAAAVRGVDLRRHLAPVPDPRPVHVRAGLGLLPPGPGRGHRLGDVRPDRGARRGQRPARAPPRTQGGGR